MRHTCDAANYFKKIDDWVRLRYFDEFNRVEPKWFVSLGLLRQDFPPGRSESAIAVLQKFINQNQKEKAMVKHVETQAVMTGSYVAPLRPIPEGAINIRVSYDLPLTIACRVSRLISDYVAQNGVSPKVLYVGGDENAEIKGAFNLHRTAEVNQFMGLKVVVVCADSHLDVGMGG